MARDIQLQGAAERNVENLEAFANRQDWQTAGEGPINGGGGFEYRMRFR